MAETWRPGRETVAIILAAVVLALPLWCVSTPAMPDYPAHLASYYLIGGGAKLPAVSHFYRIEWAFLPNLAAEIIVPLLANLTGLEIAAKLFVTAGVVMWVIGPALIHRALYGRIGVAPLFAAFFAYNANFMWGFLNYYFATGVTFLVFAAWISSDSRRSGRQLAGFAVAATVVYFCHLFAAATLLLLIACFEAGVWAHSERPSARGALARISCVAAMFLPSALAYVFLKPHGGDDSVAFNLLGTWLDRIGAAIQHHYDSPSYVLTALLFFGLAIGIWRGWAVIYRPMIIVVCALAVASLFAPEWAIGGWGVDLRLPAVFGAILFATVDVRLERRVALALGAAAVVAHAANAAILTANWRDYDRQFHEFRNAAHQLPPGTKLLTVLDGDAIGLRSDQPYWHMAEFAIIDPGAFTPLMFTTKNQHVVRLNAPFDRIAAASAEQGSPPDISELDDLAAGQIDGDVDIATVFPYLMRYQCHYDAAVVIHLDGKRSPVPHLLRLRHAGSFFSIYDIRPSSGCAGQ